MARCPRNSADVPVPLPVDPFTGKPFRYEVIGNTAHLRGTPPAGKEKDPAFNIHYEVILQKTRKNAESLNPRIEAVE